MASCVGRCFGILGSNIFFLALLAMLIATFTDRWAVNKQTNVIVDGVKTESDVRLGVYMMTVVITKGGVKYVDQHAYNWCDENKDDPDSYDKTLWTKPRRYCNLLRTSQVTVVINLAFGLVAGVVAALLSAGTIVDHKWKDVTKAAASFMFVQFLSAVVSFAAFFMLSYYVNNDLTSHYPGIEVAPGYSVALAVLCAGLVLFGSIITTGLGACCAGVSTDPNKRRDVEAGVEMKQGGQ